ncbi:hypothetical protein PPYR_13438 [Photinus pyralis]|uniref:RNA-directed DNA polymerase n=1 Tax=Photinus pyralis TaxID=7054 RepID=A0A5N4A987_PHOPY|nr:hypothetical protein PPYR_13438 [Photinus pyralis]
MFLTDVKNLVKDCEFEEDEILRDKIVLDSTDYDTMDAIIKLGDITLDEATQKYRIAEITRQQTSQMHPSHEVSEIRRQMRGNSKAAQEKRDAPGASSSRAKDGAPGASSSRARDSDSSEGALQRKKNFVRKGNVKRKCGYCGNVHERYQCPARGETCFKCKRLNHFAKMCRGQSRLHSIINADDDYYCDSIFGNKIISQHIFKKLKLKSNKNLVLNSTKVRLEGYGGSKIDNCGTVDLMIKTKDGNFKKAEFMWIDNIHTQCLNKIKSIICNAPVLQNFDNEKEIIIQTDSSKDGIGCVLMQNKKPVCFASKSLSETEMRYAQIDKEFLAILFACNRFHHYIYGRKVVVQTDHKPLVALMQKEINKINSNRLQRISMKLSVYDLEVKYVPGSKMYIADAISRACSKADNTQIDCDLNDVVHVVNVSDNLKTKLQVETGKDSALQNVIKFCENGWPKSITKLAQNVKIYYNKRNSIVYEDGLLFIDKAIIVPNTMQEVILRKVHSSHLGISKTKQRAKSLFYWPGINSDIEGLISNCKVCQRYRNRNAREPMLYHTIPELPFEIIGCDILEYANKNYLVLVDYFSKWVELKLLKSKDSVEIAHVLKEIFAIHGIPVKLIADNVPFGSFYLKQFAESWNFQLVTSSPYYPKSNGLSERYVGICKKFIKKSVDANVDLQEILLEYRNTPVMGSAYSPAQLLFSRKTRTLLPISNHSLKPKLVADFSKFLMKKKCEMKSYYDRNSKIRNYKVKPNQPVTYRYGNEWHPGSVIGTAPTPRSVIIKDSDNNRIKRRNMEDVIIMYPYHNRIVVPSNENELDLSLDVSNKSHEYVTKYGRTVKPVERLKGKM